MTTNMYGLHEQTYANGEVVQGQIVFHINDGGEYANTNMSAKDIVDYAKDSWQYIVDNKLENWERNSKPTTLAKSIKYLIDIGYEISLGFVGTIRDKDGNDLL